VKRLLFILSCLSFLLTGNAQDLKVGHIKKVKTETAGYLPSFGPGNKEIVITGQQNKGLILLNTRSGRTTQITDETVAGSSVYVNADKKIIYSVSGGVKENPVYKIYDPETGSKEELASSEVQSAKIQGKGKKLVYSGSTNGIKEFAPFGDVFYLWPSLSPDGSKILFTATTKGSFVCDLQGNIIAELGMLNAPTWINNEWVLGMQDKDNGETIQSSDVLAIHISSGKKVNITSGSAEIAIYPKASRDGRKVVFQNPAGEIFTTRITIKK